MLGKSLAIDAARALLVRTRREILALDAETRSSQWLADGNAAREAGRYEKAQKCYDKSQFWLDRFNKLTGRA